jgi:hypothetical protein
MGECVDGVGVHSGSGMNFGKGVPQTSRDVGNWTSSVRTNTSQALLICCTRTMLLRRTLHFAPAGRPAAAAAVVVVVVVGSGNGRGPTLQPVAWESYPRG